MTDRLLLDTEQATLLFQHHRWVADALDVNRSGLIAPLDDAGTLLATVPPPVPTALGHIADALRADADDLDNRIRMVLLGGIDMNAGLWALGALTPVFAAVETRGGELESDGKLGIHDLEWAAEHLDGDAAEAARWLLAHLDFVTAVARAPGDGDYLENAIRAGYLDGDRWHGDRSALLTRDSIAAFEINLDTWATLLPFFMSIDTAADGGDADGVMSKDDFDAFLAGADLPDDVRTAVQEVLADGAYHDTGGINWGTVLDTLTFVPVVGDAIDAGMALYYIGQGDFANAFAHGIGLAPIPGLSGGAVKGGRELIEEAAERLMSEGAQGAARTVAREAAESYVADELGEAAGESVAEMTDNPYLIATTEAMASAAAGEWRSGMVEVR